MFKSALPILKKGAVSLGKTALKTGLNIARDGLAGEDIKESAKQNLRLAGSNVLGDVIGGLLSRKRPAPRKKVTPVKHKRVKQNKPKGRSKVGGQKKRRTANRKKDIFD